LSLPLCKYWNGCTFCFANQQFFSPYAALLVENAAVSTAFVNNKIAAK
jgi:hypothetical protein